MNFNERRPFADPEAALAKLLEIVGALEADADGRIAVGAISHAFQRLGGNASEYGAAADGWLESHPSRAYVKLLRKSDDASP
jgi:hypothetical protein